MTNYNDGLWHGWNGGECPVHPETVVDEIALRTGISSGRKARSIAWFMTEENCPNPIIAFRVIKEHKEPREFWIVNSYTYTTLKSAVTYAKTFGFEQDEIIHVREVLE